VLIKAKKAARSLFGLHGHKDPASTGDAEAAQLGHGAVPINVCDWHYRSFVKQVCRGQQEGVGVIGMKSLGGGSNGSGRFIASKVCTAEEARTYG